jgi:hypothetical protein
VIRLNAGEEVGDMTCALQTEDAKVRFGTELGVIVEFDLRSPDKAAVVMEKRADQSRITCLFGLEAYSTAIGSVHVKEKEMQVCEAGQPVVRFGKHGDRNWAITTEKVVYF